MIEKPEKAVRIPFDSLTLRAVTEELKLLLIGGQIQDVRQPQPTEVMLGIRSRGQNRLLALSDDARFARVHLTTVKAPNAPTPPTFCMTLRKYLEGSLVLDIRQRGFDRIVEIDVGSRSNEEEIVSVTLIAELMGKHSNLILVRPDGVILESAKRVSHRINRVREVLPGLTYEPPPEQKGKQGPFSAAAPEALSELASAPPEDLSRMLVERFIGVSPFLASEIADRAARTGLIDAWNATMGMAADNRFDPVVVRNVSGQILGAYPIGLETHPPELQEPAADLNSALDSAYTALTRRADQDAVAGELKGRIAQEIKRLEAQQKALERALDESDKAELHKQNAELILANLWRIEPEAASVTVQDYYQTDQPDRDIPLDPQLSPQENAEALFRRYRKARDNRQISLERSVTTADNLERLRDLQARVTTLATAEEARALRTEVVSTGLLKEPRTEVPGKERSDFEGHKIRRFTTADGYDLLFGESATANDYLTTKVASPNDLWLHVRAASGSHLIIRTNGKPDSIPQSVLEEAALLCARHSTQKHSSLVAVDYTLRKYVRKPRGSEPGAVLYQNEKTLHVTP